MDGSSLRTIIVTVWGTLFLLLSPHQPLYSLPTTFVQPPLSSSDLVSSSLSTSNPSSLAITRFNWRVGDFFLLQIVEGTCEIDGAGPSRQFDREALAGALSRELCGRRSHLAGSESDTLPFVCGVLMQGGGQSLSRNELIREFP